MREGVLERERGGRSERGSLRERERGRGVREGVLERGGVKGGVLERDREERERES